MKKEVIFSFVFLFLIMSLGFAHSAVEGEKEVFDKAYQCLNDEIETKTCELLSLEEKIFSVLSTGKCKTELLEASLNSDKECWGLSSTTCDLKTTALATLALKEQGENVDLPVEWMKSRTINSTNVNWFLETDVVGDEEVSCSVYYDSNDFAFQINDDQTIANSAGNCLQANSQDYWYDVNPTCYEKDFEVTCERSFITTLLFKKDTEPTVYVTENVHSAAADGTTVERVVSHCFSNNLASCDYEGSLWASFVLNYLNEDVSTHLPYLIANKFDYPELIPEIFLYSLTGKLEYKNEILSKQINKQYWRINDDRFYDTPLALLPFQGETIAEKDLTIRWLMEIQGEEGCWDNKNILNNAFILYSLWPQHIRGGGSGGVDNGGTYCEDAGYHCMSNFDCLNTGGSQLPSYSCPGVTTCCSEPKKVETCSEQAGTICSSNEYCKGGRETSTDDLSYGQTCCVQGSCLPIQAPEQGCIDNGGVCEVSSCGKGYSATNTFTCDFGDICCVEDTSPGRKYVGVWVLFGGIVLTTLGILFRDRLKGLFSGLGKGRKMPPRGPPRGGSPMRRGPGTPRRILPQNRRPPVRRPQNRSPKELDDVLGKLKEMSKK